MSNRWNVWASLAYGGVPHGNTGLTPDAALSCQMWGNLIQPGNYEVWREIDCGIESLAPASAETKGFSSPNVPPI